jgi:hypothetical protein
MRREPLDLPQMKNFAVLLKEATQALGAHVRDVHCRQPSTQLGDILQTLERLYFQSDRLEREAHHALVKRQESAHAKIS